MIIEKKQKIKQIGYGYEPRAAFASLPTLSRGRLIDEVESPTRSLFQRDRDRIIHANAFRRLKHKTQVFIAAEGDHYRTRLTHTIEVSQIARALARALRLDEELAEAIALAHDLGHPPFGHAGEDVLNEMMSPYGGFDHNAQALRIVTSLENRYINFNGLNLSWETLEGLVKHNGPLMGAHSNHKNVSSFIMEYNNKFDLCLDKFAGPEAQCAAIADDIAYNAHDIDDGLRAGLITIEQLHAIGLTKRIINQIKDINSRAIIDETRIAYEIVRRQITLMVEDVIGESVMRINELDPTSVEDIYDANGAVIGFSEKMQHEEKQLKKFLYDNLYYHENVLIRRQESEKMLKKLFVAYMNDFTLLPIEWQKQAGSQEKFVHATIICDFLSGMSDQYAIREYKQLFDQA